MADKVEVLIEDQANGRDRYDRTWRIAKSGIEHIEKPRNSESGGFLRNVWAGHAGNLLAYCGRVVTDLPYSPTVGEARPCYNCLRGEAASDD